MLNVQIIPHRDLLPADSQEQKLFLMLKLRPKQEAASTRPPTAFTFLIDTSSSMDETIAGGKTKREAVIESLLGICRQSQQRISPQDQIAIIQFDNQVSTVLELTPATQTAQIESAIHHLNNFNGGTLMGLGLDKALSLMSDLPMTSRRVFLFTDGATADEDDCLDLTQAFANSNIPITAVGVGDDYNEDILVDLSGKSAGIPMHLVAENPVGTQTSILDLPQMILDQFTEIQHEVITNLAMTVRTVRGVRLIQINRAYPSQASFGMETEPFPIGNASAADETVFILEFSIDSRSASRIRIAQLGLTYEVPGKNRREELPLQNVVVEFVAGQIATQVNQEVMGYVQQCNISKLVNEAAQVAEHNPAEAEKKLDQACRMTQRLGNQA
jgi:Ca-activated chloride channel family protein